MVQYYLYIYGLKFKDIDMSTQLTQYIFMLQVENFQRKILGINPEKLSKNILEKSICDKFNHLIEENEEVNKALSNFAPLVIDTYYEVIDGYIDILYIVLAIRWMRKYHPLTNHQIEVLKYNYRLLGEIRKILPREIPYVYAFNLVHKANMQKIPGKKPGRITTTGYDAIKPSGWKEPNWPDFFKKYVLNRESIKTLILGDARSGKDTYAEYLQYWYGYVFVPAFDIYGPYVLKELRKIGYIYSSLEECKKDRFDKRDLWFNFLTEYNKSDNTKLTRHILAKSDIYPGIRRLQELEATVNLFDRYIYIDASCRVEKESIFSNEITIENAKHIIGNKLEIVKNNDSLIKYVYNIWNQESKREK